MASKEERKNIKNSWQHFATPDEKKQCEEWIRNFIELDLKTDGARINVDRHHKAAPPNVWICFKAKLEEKGKTVTTVFFENSGEIRYRVDS